jgi:putative SOS response-associated peptidase YedK
MAFKCRTLKVKQNSKPAIFIFANHFARNKRVQNPPWFFQLIWQGLLYLAGLFKTERRIRTEIMVLL